MEYKFSNKLKSFTIIIFIGFIFVFGSFIYTHKAYASIICSGDTGPCSGMAVGRDGCYSGGIPSVCEPKDFNSGPTNSAVSCQCVQSNQDVLQQIDTWNNKYATSSASSCENGIPSACTDSYVPDFACINKKIIDPGYACCENTCIDSSGNPTSGVSDPGLEKYREFGILGLTVKITPESIPSLINVLLSTFLGIIALYALFRGIYVAAIKRTQATEENLEAVNKELTNIVIAFVIAFASIFIIQLVFNLLGLGSLNKFNVNFTNEDTSGPALVINSNGSQQ